MCVDIIIHRTTMHLEEEVEQALIRGHSSKLDLPSIDTLPVVFAATAVDIDL